MSKELQALQRIREALAKHFDIDDIYEWSIFEEDFELIETTLKENAELKKCIDLIGDVETNNKKLKAFEIIITKRVDIPQLMLAKDYHDYNFCRKWSTQIALTQEEFNLLKETVK